MDTVSGTVTFAVRFTGFIYCTSAPVTFPFTIFPGFVTLIFALAFETDASEPFCGRGALLPLPPSLPLPDSLGIFSIFVALQTVQVYVRIPSSRSVGYFVKTPTTNLWDAFPFFLTNSITALQSLQTLSPVYPSAVQVASFFLTISVEGWVHVPWTPEPVSVNSFVAWAPPSALPTANV